MRCRMPSLPLACPGMLCGAGDALAPVHSPPNPGQRAAPQQPRSPLANPELPGGALACIASAQRSLGQADEIINL